MLLHIEFLGHVRVMVGGCEDAFPLPHRSVSLLACFALSPAHQVARDVLIERLWPDLSEKAGHHCLSSALWRLRSALTDAGRSLIVGDDNGNVGLRHGSSMWLDARALCDSIRPTLGTSGRLDAAASAGLMRGLDLYRGDLLEGHYDDWILTERERVRSICIRGRMRLLEHHAAGGEFDAALDCGQEVLRLEPLREDVHRRVMEMFLLKGDRVGAHRQYARLGALLDEELGVPPMRETRAVLERY
jgi:DNA-binding SARP family transcriptional activator